MIDREKLLRLYWIQGLKDEEIGKLLGKSRDLITLRRRKLNIPSRKEFIRNFEKYVKLKDVDFFLRYYLLKRKWRVQKPNIPRLQITSLNRDSLECLKNYLKKHGITSSLTSYLKRWYLVITGYSNFQKLSEIYRLPFWEEIKKLKGSTIL